MGDGVLVYFGYPQAHEDDADRAVRAGLELVAAVSGLKTHALLQTRVGISTPQVSTYCATRGKHYADALERAGVRVHHVCHGHMIHHFYAMAGAIPYARTALKAVGADIRAALSPVKALSAV